MKRIIAFTLSVFAVACSTPSEKTWVAIGDSITYLNEHPDETGDRITKGYLTRVSEQIPYLHYVNKGYNGWTAGDIAREIDNLDLTSADLFTVFLGTNDWWHGRPTDEYPYPPESIGMTYDGLHPSDAGYEVIAEMLQAKIKL